jgi:hypothetical protein
MKRINIIMARILYRNISPELKQKICTEYLNGSPSTVLHKKYDFTPTTILRIVRELGGHVKTNKEVKTKYTFNHSFFTKINTEAKAYFLGLLLADGHTSYKEVMLYLNAKDKHIIETFINSINGNNKIHERTGTVHFDTKEYISKAAGVSLRSDQMLNDLKKLGVTANKTYKIKIPKIKKELQKHFWRGVWDGDGYISHYHSKAKYKQADGNIKIYNNLVLEVGLCGLKNVLKEFCKFLKQNNIKPGKIYKDSSIYSMRCNWTEGYKLLNLLYKNSTLELHLKRKYDKYLEYQKLKSFKFG